MASHTIWPDPPGYRAALSNTHRPPLGWAVLTPHGTIAVLTVRDWPAALRSCPYAWLNTHPLQPAPPELTRALAEETIRNHMRQP